MQRAKNRNGFGSFFVDIVILTLICIILLALNLFVRLSGTYPDFFQAWEG